MNIHVMISLLFVFLFSVSLMGYNAACDISKDNYVEAFMIVVFSTFFLEASLVMLFLECVYIYKVYLKL